jgi:3-hydroxy-9,10-secoandrosta-1,3,5(10)-triene-9,17-dione monooxygenase reductase component
MVPLRDPSFIVLLNVNGAGKPAPPIEPRDNRLVVAGDELREVMRLIPAPVSVVTVDLEGERLGLTVASLVSLSLEPPLVGVAIRREAALHELLRRAGRFGVSILAAGQEHLAQHFARGVPPIALWQGIPVREVDGPPLLEGALAWLSCGVRDEHETGDHTLFVGQVLEAETGGAERALVYVGRRYVPA